MNSHRPHYSVDVIRTFFQVGLFAFSTNLWLLFFVFGWKFDTAFQFHRSDWYRSW